MVLASEELDVEVFIRDVIAVSPESVASGTQRFRLNRRVIINGAARSEKSADAVSEPQCCKDVDHLLGIPESYIAFRVHERNVDRKPVLPPDIKDVAHQLRLAEQI